MVCCCGRRWWRHQPSEEKRTRKKTKTRQTSDVCLFLRHLHTLVCTFQAYLDQFAPCLQAVVGTTTPCCRLTLDREAINDNGCCFQEWEQPGRNRMHMSAAHFQPPASAIVRVRSVRALSAWIPLDVKLQSEKENICTALK